MAVTATIVRSMATIETFSEGSVASSNATITHNGYDESNALTSATTPPITKCAFFLGTLTAGALTIDLTALTGTNGGTVDGSGLKVQAIHLKNLGANAMTFAVGASNGYDLAGSGFSVTLAQNQDFLFYGNDATPDIGASDKTIDVSGTGSQTFECSILLG